MRTLPASDKYIALYLVALLQQGGTCHIVESVLYSIRWFLEIKGYPDPTCSLSRNMLECAKRIAKPLRKPKEPLTPAMLRSIYNTMDTSNLLHFRKFVLLLISYAGFLRFDEASNLRKGDFTFYHTHMTIFLEKSKTDQYRDGRTLVISRVPSDICPVYNMLQYFRMAKLSTDDSFIFRPLVRSRCPFLYKTTKINRSLSYTTCRLNLIEVISKIGLDPKKFGLHSARSGGATWAANAGVPDRLFKRHGNGCPKVPRTVMSRTI